MARFECNICGSIATGSSEPAKCVNCGTVKGGWDRKKLPPLILTHNANTLVVVGDRKSFGRDQFRVFGYDIFKYAAAVQFDITAGVDAWQIEGKTGTPTHTLLNGVDISGRLEIIKAGDEIQVGPLKLKTDLRA